MTNFLRLVALLILAGLVLAQDEPVLRMPSMPDWQLVHKVEPKYPSAAIEHRIEGTVRFADVIGKDGHIEASRLVSGHPSLVRAAREAARQWIYRGLGLLSGKPVRVMTQLEVVFQLDFHEQSRPAAGRS